MVEGVFKAIYIRHCFGVKQAPFNSCWLDAAGRRQTTVCFSPTCLRGQVAQMKLHIATLIQGHFSGGSSVGGLSVPLLFAGAHRFVGSVSLFFGQLNVAAVGRK